MTTLFTQKGAVRQTDLALDDLAVLCRLVRAGKVQATIVVEGERGPYPLDVASIDGRRTFGSGRYRGVEGP